MDTKKEEPETIVIEKKKPEVKKGLSTNSNGELSLESINDQMAYAQKLINEKMISSTFKTAQQVVIGIQYAISLKMDALPALRNMYVIKGRPCLWGDGPLSLAQRTGKIEGFEEFYVNKDLKKICYENKNLKDEVYASVCRIKRKGDECWQEDFFTLDDMKKAGLAEDKWGKKETYKKYQRIMIRYKARTLSLKSKFADLLNGMDVAEYNQHFSPQTPDIHFDAKTGEDINEKIKEL